MNTVGKVSQRSREGRVLVVDDEFVHAEHSRYTLSDAGWLVVGFECDPKQALTKLAKYAPDIVLVDICFPCGISGFDLLDNMRQVADLHGLPSPFAVFLTGYGDAQTRAQAAAVRGSLYLEKPISDEELDQGIERAASMLPQWRAEFEAERNLRRQAAEWSEDLNAERFDLIQRRDKKSLTDREEARLKELDERMERWLRQGSSLNSMRADQALAELQSLPELEKKADESIWPEELNAERFQLTEKEFAGGLNDKEKARLKKLEDLQDYWLRQNSTLDLAYADKVLAELRALPDSG